MLFTTPETLRSKWLRIRRTSPYYSMEVRCILPPVPCNPEDAQISRMVLRLVGWMRFGSRSTSGLNTWANSTNLASEGRSSSNKSLSFIRCDLENQKQHSLIRLPQVMEGFSMKVRFSGGYRWWPEVESNHRHADFQKHRSDINITLISHLRSLSNLNVPVNVSKHW